MRLEFLNRNNEKARLTKLLSASAPVFAVIYGRRRCGKSTLIANIISGNDIFFLADQSEPPIQRRKMAKEIAGIIPGFDKAEYPDWESIFISLDNSLKNPLKRKTNLFIDEFPYLVKSSPELPGIIQRIIDLRKHKKYNLIICGSSQQMMHGIVLDKAAPLYGRADYIIRIEPMRAGWITEALKCDAHQAVFEYGVFGGVPRYWELRKNFNHFETAVKELILEKNGILHEEPMRLFLDDMKSSVQAYSILTLIAQGCHRISEIASKLGKPVTDFSRPLANLIDLGYVRKEIPFGEPENKSKKGLYKIADNFIKFYFTFVSPNKSNLEIGLTNAVFDNIKTQFLLYFSGIWEDLVRESIPFSGLYGNQWTAAKRWWGTGTDKKRMEIDFISESADKKSLLFGEIKWSAKVNAVNELQLLGIKANNTNFIKKHEYKNIIFNKTKAGAAITPDSVFKWLK